MSKKPRLGSNLEWHGNKIRVVVKVPPTLRDKLGKAQLRQSLPTASPREAEVLKWPVITQMKKQLGEARKNAPDDPMVQEALAWKEALRDPETLADNDTSQTVQYALDNRIDDIASAQGHARARTFAAIASGTATPLDTYLHDWLHEKSFAGRTEAAYRHSIKVLKEWCEETSVTPSLEAISRKIAGEFIRDRFVRQNTAAATANKTVTGLSSYWSWLVTRGHLPEGTTPWARQFVQNKTKSRQPSALDKVHQRPFTDAEAGTLLNGIEREDVLEFSLWSALTGMRLNEIAELRVRDIVDGAVHVHGTKTASASRIVPLHSALSALASRRTANKPADAYLFDELEDQTNAARGRGSPISQAFTRIRRSLGVDDTPEGARRSRIDFHSWRRWFISKAVRALENGAIGFTPWTLAEIVGHSKEDGPLPMTMGRYPGAAPMEARRACVEAVKLPVLGTQ